VIDQAEPEPADTGHLASTVQLVAAYVSNNSMHAAELGKLIETVHAALGALGGQTEQAAPETQLVPAVPIKKSITPDFLICLEDGKKFRSLKRHLGTVYGMTPDAYRAKWSLPRDYPMVAPAYSAVRSKLAKDIGLGRQAGESKAGETGSAEPAAKKAGRGKR
jgi:predicted transcriptional regulator